MREFRSRTDHAEHITESTSLAGRMPQYCALKRVLTGRVRVQLPLTPQSFASYDRVVSRVAHVLSTPTEMESTTHVLAWGHDLYYTLLSPARRFDSLQDDFSFALLTIALASLAGGAAFMSQLVKKAQLKAKWQ